MNDLAIRFRQCRLKKNLSQHELADKLKVTQSTICKWESGKLQIDAIYHNAISRVFGKKWGEYN